MKHFEVRHAKSAMKVGTDSLLLGAWCPVQESVQNVLDIGSGCGILSLMLAQRLPKAQITGVELDGASHAESLENVARSDWYDRITMVCSDVKVFDPADFFNVIISNPPYFKALQPGSESRIMARHQQSLNTEELFFAVDRLLSSTGTFSLIIPFDQKMSYLLQAERVKLFAHQMVVVRHQPHLSPKRMLMTFGRVFQPIRSSQLTIGNDKDRSEEYKALLRPFLIHI